jgi:hypothetical protein
MRGNSHVRFLGDRVGVILPGYPTVFIEFEVMLWEKLNLKGA